MFDERKIDQILEEACCQVNGIEPIQLKSALDSADYKNIGHGVIAVDGLRAMARSLVVTGSVPKIRQLSVNTQGAPMRTLKPCRDCRHFEHNPGGGGGIGRCLVGCGYDVAPPTARHPGGYLIGPPHYPGIERDCKRFTRRKPHAA